MRAQIHSPNHALIPMAAHSNIGRDAGWQLSNIVMPKPRTCPVEADPVLMLTPIRVVWTDQGPMRILRDLPVPYTEPRGHYVKGHVYGHAECDAGWLRDGNARSRCAVRGAGVQSFGERVGRLEWR